MFSVPFIPSQVKYSFALFPVTKVFSLTLTATNFRVCVSGLGKNLAEASWASAKKKSRLELLIVEVWEQETPFCRLCVQQSAHGVHVYCESVFILTSTLCCK